MFFVYGKKICNGEQADTAHQEVQLGSAPVTSLGTVSDSVASLHLQPTAPFKEFVLYQIGNYHYFAHYLNSRCGVTRKGINAGITIFARLFGLERTVADSITSQYMGLILPVYIPMGK